MKNFILIALLLGGSQIITSCNSTKSIAKITKHPLYVDTLGIQPTLFTVNTDATQRIGIIMVNKGKFVTFSENPPDAAIQATMGFLADAKVTGKVDASAKLDFAKTIAQLGNRSEAINFQRDGMFRLSEMYNNGALDSNQLVILIDNLQNNAVKIAEFASKSEEMKNQAELLKEMNKLFALADSTSTKPTNEEIVKLVNKFGE